MHFIFAQDPLIFEANQARKFEMLEMEFGINKGWFHFVKWDPSCKVCSSCEPDIKVVFKVGVMRKMKYLVFGCYSPEQITKCLCASVMCSQKKDCMACQFLFLC